MGDEGGKKLQQLGKPAANFGLAILTGNPVGVVSATGQGITAFFTPSDTNEVFLAEFADFVFVELTKRVANLERQAHATAWRVDEAETRLNEVVAQLAEKQDMTATETAAILNEVRGVYSRSLDPEKRRLVGAALRSCLLDRERYDRGFRRRLLSILDALEFGDVLVLAAVAHPDDDALVAAAGLNRMDFAGRKFATASTGTLVAWHLTHLDQQGVVINMTGAPAPSELGQMLLSFVEANPETLLSRPDP